MSLRLGSYSRRRSGRETPDLYKTWKSCPCIRFLPPDGRPESQSGAACGRPVRRGQIPIFAPANKFDPSKLTAAKGGKMPYCNGGGAPPPGDAQGHGGPARC